MEKELKIEFILNGHYYSNDEYNINITITDMDELIIDPNLNYNQFMIVRNNDDGPDIATIKYDKSQHDNIINTLKSLSFDLKSITSK